MAQAISRFGVKVSIIEGQDCLLPNNEPETGELLSEIFESEGISVYTENFAEEVTYSNDEFQ